jgi:uncharacterized membrane protein YccC
MIGTASRSASGVRRLDAVWGAVRRSQTINALTPALLFGLRLWASVCLALYLAFWLQLDDPAWAGTSAAIMCQPHLGASLRKGWYRLVGTLIGAVAIVVMTGCFAQDRFLFLGTLALWGAASAFVATLLRNFASYSAALAGYTAAIVAGDLLGATGGIDGNAAFLLAVARATEICTGIVCAGVVLAITDLGGARLRLARVFGGLAAEIMTRFTRVVGEAGPNMPDTQAERREFVRRVINLDPIIDEALGESSQLRYHSPVLQDSFDGLIALLTSWRAMGVHLFRLPAGQAIASAAEVLSFVPRQLQSDLAPGGPRGWMTDPTRLHHLCVVAMHRLLAFPAETPSLRLLADQMADALAGMAKALNGLALLVGDPARPAASGGTLRLRVPDWLPATVNAGRAFVTIVAVSLFWIVTTWPNGADAITFAAIIVILFAPRAEQAYAAGMLFMIGAILDSMLAATVAFAVLPGLGTETFVGFSLVLGACLVPVGAFLVLARQPWQIALATGMNTLFLPLLAPANQESYDTLQFYNTTVAIVVGTGMALMSFRLLPPLSQAYRARRLLGLTLRDLRRIAVGRTYHDWRGRMHGRLAALPDAATALQRGQLLAALCAGHEMVELRVGAHRLGVGADLERALTAVSQGKSVIAVAHLDRLDRTLAERAGITDGQAVLRLRARILALSESLTEHAAYFDAAVTL